MLLGAYRLALDATRRAAEASLGRVIRALYSRSDRDESINVLVPALTETVRAHRREAYGHAVELIESQARDHGVDAPYVPAQSGYSEDSVRTLLKEDLRGSPDEAVELIAPKLGQHVEDAARQTVIRTVEDGREPGSKVEEQHRSHDALSPEEFEALEERSEDAFDRLRRRYIVEGRALNWARVLSGAENCGFCVMLASRGPVYRSEESAGRREASDLYDTTAAGWVNSYHPGCDCLVVPIYDYGDWDGRDQWQAAEKFYRSAVENAEWDRINAKNPDLAAVEQALRRLSKEGGDLPVEDLRAAYQAVRAAA